MLEILVLWAVAKRVGRIAERKGHKRGSYKVLTIIFWIGGEVLGGIFGVMATTGRQSPQCFIYLSALAGAAVGAAFALFVADQLSVNPASLPVSDHADQPVEIGMEGADSARPTIRR